GRYNGCVQYAAQGKGAGNRRPAAPRDQGDRRAGARAQDDRDQHRCRFPRLGALLGYGSDPREHYQRAAVYIAKILKGAKPGQLPIEQPTTFELIVNMKTAKAIGLTVPKDMLVRANEVIE